MTYQVFSFFKRVIQTFSEQITYLCFGWGQTKSPEMYSMKNIIIIFTVLK